MLALVLPRDARWNGFTFVVLRFKLHDYCNDLLVVIVSLVNHCCYIMVVFILDCLLSSLYHVYRINKDAAVC